MANENEAPGDPTSALEYARTALVDSTGGAVAPAPHAWPTSLETVAAPTGARASDAPPAPRVGNNLRHYEIIRKLGQGGMGEVFLARDTKLGRLIAIKVLLAHDAQAAERFLAEARSTARCTHENIVIIHEVDEASGHPYMALEYLEGGTLRERMDERRGPLPPGVAAELILPVVRALGCAHALGIVHRDLKPENVFLTDAGAVKVLDFGIAKQLGARDVARLHGGPSVLVIGGGGGVSGALTQEGALVGTLPYMAPEQWRLEDVDARADLWAVGILLFELCAGEHPLAPLTMRRLLEVQELDDPMPRADAGALGAVIDRCLRKRRDERFASAEELIAALEPLLPGRKALELGEDESPFAGLAAFQEVDAGRFFGRERDVAGVLGRLREQPLVAVAGPSGAGKSSFVRAGVIPGLKRSGERWEAFTLRPGRGPLAALADVLAQLGVSPESASANSPDAGDPEQLVAALRARPGVLGARLRARCRRQGEPHRAVLFVDQLEELYTHGVDPAERDAFVACLEGVADDASSPLRVVLAVRSDFLDRLAEDRRLMREVTRGLWFLPPLGREGLEEALMRPIEAAGYRFESEATPRAMLAALDGARSPLPLLQFTAAKLWEARDRGRRLLTQESYEKLGGVAGALSTHADAVLAGLSALDQRLCRSILLRLVTLERTRAVVGLAELRGLAGDGASVEQVVRHLADARLLLLETGGDGATVELVHESLIERWSRLKQWLDESERDAQFLARLRAAAHQWAASEAAEGLLWRDRAAEDARAFLERRRAQQGRGAALGLGVQEERYLLAVVAHSERARRLRQRLAVGAIAGFATIALVVSFLAMRASRAAARADLEAAEARNATRMATARELAAGDPTSAIALLREIEPVGVPRGWADLAFDALHGGLALVVLSHPGTLNAAAWSPDGRRIVTASRDQTARVWNADGTGTPLILRGHQGPVTSAAWSPDGRRIVTASWDQTARVWSADGTGEPVILRGHEERVSSAAWSPDGLRVVTASRDQTARIWNADGKGEPVILRGHEDRVAWAAWSPDGQRIVTASFDKTARIWSADGKGQPRILRGHEGGVISAAWSPDGRRIATASDDKTVRVWSADGAGEPLILRGHDGWVTWVTWSPDGRRILTASLDKTVRTWNADGTGEPRILRGRDDVLTSAAWSPDGRRILTASEDKTARVWDAGAMDEPKVLRGHEDRAQSVAWSPDGKRLVTASWDKTARIWDAGGAGDPLILRGHDERVTSAAWSPDGQRVVTASADKTARVWSADGKGEPSILRGHEGAVASAAWSPDGKRIVTASADRTARVWGADGKGEPLVLRGHEGALTSAAWSPDGRRIVTTSFDRTVRVWSADGKGEPLVLRGHDDVVYAAAWSPDGMRIVTVSNDETARVWSVDGTGEPVVLRGHEASVAAAAWSPDGRRVVTVSNDKTARVWSADGTGEPVILRGHENRVSGVAWSPDGLRVATASYDKTIRVWADLAPLHGPDDPRLWRATRYCMSTERRVTLLSSSPARARADEEACERRIAAVAGP